MISLGCPKNLVDSEMILGSIGSSGFQIIPDPEDADIIVINTCSFIDNAKEESVNTILEACELKASDGSPRKVVVTGCLAQRYGEDLRKEVPEVDAIIGLGQYENIGDVLNQLIGRDPASAAHYQVADPNFACNAETGRMRLTPRHFAYLRISEGCDNPCTFCAIPKIRGQFRSKPIPMIEEEVRELVDGGAREIVIISQDTTSYGVDLDGVYQLPKLLESIAAIRGVEWIRLLYVYPACFSDDMIDAVAAIPQVVKYVDIPLQHITDNMLRRMGRRLSERKTRELLEKMRTRIPGLYLRTTFIVGFPGEEEDDYQGLLRFVDEFRFERLGSFLYSHEEDTPAYRMRLTVPPELAAERLDGVMTLQQDIAFEQNRSRVGSTAEVLIDGQNGADWLSRSYGEAPEIDPLVLIPDERGEIARGEPSDRLSSDQVSSDQTSSNQTLQDESSSGFRELPTLGTQERLVALAPYQQLKIGELVPVEIIAAKGYDLIARPLPIEK
jgi:ribosomal protein S12 methylthiotransferase